MAWTLPTAYTIDANTYIKDTDDNIQGTMDDLEDYVNSTGDYVGTGLTTDFVNRTTAQTIAGVKTFSDTPVFNDNFMMGAIEVTASGGELNILDGVTATTAELNILDGVTATATELNILDGVTATTAELNILDGLTLTSGTYTPNITDTVNVASLTIGSARYIRIGNIVHVSAVGSITCTSAGSSTYFELSLPIAENLVLYDLSGSFTTNHLDSGTIQEDTTSNTAKCYFKPSLAVGAGIQISFSYEIT